MNGHYKTFYRPHDNTGGNEPENNHSSINTAIKPLATSDSYLEGEINPSIIPRPGQPIGYTDRYTSVTALSFFADMSFRVPAYFRRVLHRKYLALAAQARLVFSNYKAIHYALQYTFQNMPSTQKSGLDSKALSLESSWNFRFNILMEDFRL